MQTGGRHALVLTGSIGMGHHVVTGVVADALAAMGMQTDVLDCMSLLGPFGERAGDWVFRRLMNLPTLYDGLHFAHLRTGSPLALAMDRAATRRLVPALSDHLQSEPADLVVATFATGASAMAKLVTSPDAVGLPPPATVVLCTDVTPHRLWVHPGVDLYAVTSSAAAAAVRRYQPSARVAVVPPPVRSTFAHPPAQASARVALGISVDARCVLLMGGGWGLGPLAVGARALAGAGVEVLAVAGDNHRAVRALERAARVEGRIHVFGLTDRVAQLMAAADVVVTTPGASTCGEARAVGRHLVLLDVVPGHGRDNVQHELALGGADVSDAEPSRLVASVLGVLDRVAHEPAAVPLSGADAGAASLSGAEAGAGAGAEAGAGATFADAFAAALATLRAPSADRSAAGPPSPAPPNLRRFRSMAGEHASTRRGASAAKEAN